MASDPQENRRSLFFDREEIISMRKEGASVRELCRRFDVGDRRMKKVLERWGLVAEKGSAIPGSQHAPPIEDKAKDAIGRINDPDSKEHAIVLALCDAGVSSTYIADKFGVRPRQMRHLLDKWGRKKNKNSPPGKCSDRSIPMVTKSATIGGKDIDCIRKAYADGATCTELAKACHVGYYNMSSYLKAWGVPMRSNAENLALTAKKKAKNSPQSIPQKLAGFSLGELSKLYRDGMSAKKLAAEMGVDSRTLVRFFRLNGVATRPHVDAIRVYVERQGCR